MYDTRTEISQVYNYRGYIILYKPIRGSSMTEKKGCNKTSTLSHYVRSRGKLKWKKERKRKHY